MLPLEVLLAVKIALHPMQTEMLSAGVSFVIILGEMSIPLLYCS